MAQPTTTPAATAGVVKSTTKVVNSMKRVKEEVVRFDWDCAPVPQNINPGAEVELYTFNGTPGDRHDVRIGECEELLSLGIDPAVDAGGRFIDRFRVADRDQSEWNQFLTIPQSVRPNANQMPFNNALNFERQMMSWGYKSFLSSPIDLASTLKLPEGDQLRLYIRASPANAAAVNAGNNRTSAIVRRYLSGSDVDYKHFNQYDGGLKSNKRYYNDVQFLLTTVINQWVQSWRLQILRNEAYKFFQGGILPDVIPGAFPYVSTLTQARIMIDDPMTQYNEYFCNFNHNNLPFVDTAFVEGFAGASHWPMEKKHRFAPTIDILKNRNRDLTVYVRDNGVAAANIYTHMVGIKYQV